MEPAVVARPRAKQCVKRVLAVDEPPASPYESGGDKGSAVGMGREQEGL